MTANQEIRKLKLLRIHQKVELKTSDEEDECAHPGGVLNPDFLGGTT